MRRKLVITVGLVVAVAILAVAALPWWFGAALGVVGGRFGIEFGAYRKIGYTRFALEDVVVTRPGVTVKASRVELATPLLWLANQPGDVKVGKWNVVVASEGKPRETGRTTGWRSLRVQLDTVVTLLDIWLPPATADAGEIRFPGGKLDVAGVDWDATEGARLSVRGLAWRDESADVVVVREKADAPLIVTARATDGDWDATVESDAAGVSLRGNWAGQPMTARALFGEAGWLPTEVEANATNWNLPARRAGLATYYQTITGGAALTWANGVARVDVQAAARPVEGGEVPPLDVTLRGEGGPDRLNIEQLDIRIPGVSGRLSEPISLGRDARALTQPSRFELEVDLEKQPWFEGRGKLAGRLEVIPHDAGIPLLRATLAGDGATVADWTAIEVAVDASLQWPALRVVSAKARLKGGDELRVEGEADLRTRALSGVNLRGRVSKETASRWLSEETTFDMIEVNATANGVWPDIVHAGDAKATRLLMRPLKPATIDLTWDGNGARITSATVDIEAGQTRARVRGAIDPEAARIDELVLTQSGDERLRLTEPTRVRWTPTLTVEPFVLKGPEAEAGGRITWGTTGEVKLTVKHVPSTWFVDLVEMHGPDWTASRVDMDGRWAEGPLTFRVEGDAAFDLVGGREAEWTLTAQGDGHGLRIETLRAAMDQRVVARAGGVLPLTLHPAQPNPVRVAETAPLSVEVETEPHAVFWEELGKMTGLFIDDPRVRLVMKGTVRKLEGEGTAHIAKIQANPEGRLRRMPDMEALAVRLTGDSGGIALEELSFKIAGQQVRGNGRLPVEQWEDLLQNPLAVVKTRGEARIQIPDANVAALARYAPAYLAPTGRLHVDVTLQRGEWEGVVRLTDAASRPLGPLGTLQEIGAEIALKGRKVEFKELRASAGGQPVKLSGTVELPDGGTPRLDLALRGEKLPFVRQAGMLMRGDIDLKVVTADDGVTTISGRTDLRDSFFLMDVRALIPRGGPRSAPGRRPPYFSVDTPPFEDWRLDVAVRGERFLRLRTPVFTGLASARFRLGGTLHDPRAVGEAVVNQGRVLLPFATFDVRQGEVRLTETNPFEPRVVLIGTSRRYGYDLRMELRGTAEKPELTFTSTPPLESEQVLLMVMTGETPQNEVSYSGRERAARLGAYLGQSLLRQLGGDPEATDRLSISVGERISRQGRETYNAEYELSPRWSLVGEYDEFDEYNVGVKWRVWSGGTKTEAKDETK